MKLFVVRDDQPENLLTQYHRVLWCPQSSFTDDESDEDEDDHLPHLAVSNGTLVSLGLNGVQAWFALSVFG